MPNNDPFRWTDVLQKIAKSSVAESLRKGNATNDSDQAVAYLWTETVGKCLLNGIEVEESCQINSQVAQLALACGKSFVRDSIRDLEEIEADIATSDTQLEIDEYVCSPLEERMDYWAVTIAGEAAIRESQADDASKALLEFIGLVEEFDEGLETKTEDICLAANTNLLSNWADSLDSKYTDPLPWWLDGRLEKQLNEIATSVEAPLRCGLQKASVRAWDTHLAVIVDPKKVAYTIEPLLNLAAASGETRNTRGELSWSHPVQPINARMLKPVSVSEETEVWLEFTDKTYEPANDLIGKQAHFGEVTSTIEKTAIGGVTAKFYYKQLIDQSEEERGELIIDGIPWIFTGVQE